MGRKKTQISACKKPEIPQSTSASPTPTYALNPLELEALKRVIAAQRECKLEDFFKILEDTCQVYKNCSVFHRLHGMFARELSAMLPSISRELLYKAIESSRKAIELVPISLEYRHFHASILYALAVLEHKGFEKVIDECERALAIENPEEPLWDLYMLQEDKYVRPKNRPELIRNSIVRLISESRLSMPPTVSNQITSEALPMVERPRIETNTKLKAADYRRLLIIRKYWNSMSLKMKQNLFEVRVEDLKKHSRKLLKNVVKDCGILYKILPVYTHTQSWRFYLCYTCGEKFFDVDKLMQHGCIQTIKKPDTPWPTFASNAVVDDLLNINWKPCDIEEALRMTREEHLTVEEVLQNYPLSMDLKRIRYVSRIQDKLLGMVEKGILSNSTVDWLRWKVYTHVDGKFADHVWNVDIHLCIGLLQRFPLRQILQSLEVIDGVGESSQKILFRANDDIIPKVKFPSFIYNSSLDTISLDTCFFRNNKGTSGDAEDVESNNPDANDFLSLIFYCQSHKEVLVSKIHGIEDKENMWKSAILIMDDYFTYLTTASEKKAEIQIQLDAMKYVVKFCTEEHKKITDKESVSDFITRLSNHQQELDAAGSNPNFHAYRFMDDVISATRLINHEMNQFLSQSDQVQSGITCSAHRPCSELHKKLSKLDAKILQALSAIVKINQMLRSLSFLDYEDIVSILLASYLQLSLENLEKKDALEKMVAAGEDLLKEESDGSKKKLIAGTNIKKIKHDTKSIKKKKTKDKRTMNLKEKTMGLDGACKDVGFSQEKSISTLYPLLENVVLSENYIIQEDIHGKDKIIVEEVEEHSYFFVVIFKSLWHLRWFRTAFNNSVAIHSHVGDPCVFCNMNDIFVFLDTGAKEGKIELISHHTLTIFAILKNSYADRNFLNEMNVSPKAFAVVLLLLHITSLPALEGHGARSDKNSYPDHDFCRCLPHTVFGMDIHENVKNCPIKSQEPRYTSWFYKIDAQVQDTNQVYSFNNLFKNLETEDLSIPPRVLAAVINWHKDFGSAAHINSILEAIDTHIELSFVEHAADYTNKYSLMCMICYSRPKHQCFTYSDENEKWTIIDGETEEETGGWDDVKQICVTRNLQPEILFFEAEN